MKKIAALIIILLFPVTMMAQEENGSIHDWEEILESVMASQNDNADQETIYNDLVQLHENPIDLNKSEKGDFNVLFFLTQSQIDSILLYRSRHEYFLSVKELNFIEGLDESTMHFLSAFVTVNPDNESKVHGLKDRLRNSHVKILSKYFRHIEKSEGYRSDLNGEKPYLGDPARVFSRVSVSVPNELSLSFSMEKDPGEAFIWSPEHDYYGFDQYNYHAAIYNIGHVKKMIAGDYKAQFGQGLVMGNGFYLGKCAETIASIDNKASGFRPYGGSGESGIFRGLAITAGFKNIEISGMVSYRNSDARLDTISTQGATIVRSILNSGLHRTASEIEKRKNLRVFVAGSHVSYHNTLHFLEIGSTLVYTRFPYIYMEEPKYYNQYHFTGRQLFTGGFDFRFTHRVFSVFGEIGFSGINEKGFVCGLIVNLSKNLETSLSIRNFGLNFHSLYGNPIREASSLECESGIYWGMKILPLRNVVLNFYVDVFQFPWLRYNIHAPSDGNEIFVRFIWTPVRRMEFYFQFLQKNSTLDETDPAAGIVSQTRGNKYQYWSQLSYDISPQFVTKSRIQMSRFFNGNNGSGGYAVFQDLGWKSKTISLHGRIAWFDTDDYDNRQYMYEQGALYDFQIPVFYGKGLRLYSVVNGRIGNRFRYWVKAGRSIYTDQKSIGSGNDRIEGNHKTDILIQMELIL